MRPHSDTAVLVGGTLVLVTTRLLGEASHARLEALGLADSRLPLFALAVALVAAALRSRGPIATVLLVAASALGAAGAWADLGRHGSGEVSAVAVARGDPTWDRGRVRIVLEIESRRYLVHDGGANGRRLARLAMGETVNVRGVLGPLDEWNRRRLAHRHVVGSFAPLEVGESIAAGAPWLRSANRLRMLLAKAASHMPRDEGALFVGLVIGDERGQSSEMRTAFRASGLSHLTAVSGQNVAFVLGALAPLTSRLRRVPRLMAIGAILVWFVAVTRVEPSVVRAASMAGLGALGVALGHDAPSRRVLGLALGGLVIADPLLAWSVGFWMSSAATAGLVLLTPPLARRIPGPRWLALPLASTLGAQLAVTPVTLLVFRSVPLLGVVANLLAVPVAGVAMFVGLPLGLAVGLLATVAEWLDVGGTDGLFSAAMWPVTLAVRWVWWVSAVTARLTPW